MRAWVHRCLSEICFGMFVIEDNHVTHLRNVTMSEVLRQRTFDAWWVFRRNTCANEVVHRIELSRRQHIATAATKQFGATGRDMQIASQGLQGRGCDSRCRTWLLWWSCAAKAIPYCRSSQGDSNCRCRTSDACFGSDVRCDCRCPRNMRPSRLTCHG